MQLRSSALSDIGLQRPQNEDRFLRNDGLYLYGVADGIGGLPYGAEAAETAVESVQRCIGGTSTGLPQVENCVLQANNDVYSMALGLSPLQGMGTTLTFGVIRKQKLHLAHVGDSRCYLLRGGAIRCLTTDHNLENEAKQRMAQGEHVVLSERNRAALTRCIGQPIPPTPDILTLSLESGDRLFFCTDGLFRAISQEEIGEILSRISFPDVTMREFIDLANHRGGYDNATGVLVLLD